MPDALMIFVLPPNMQELEERLTDRGRDDADAMHARLATARKEIDLAKSSGAYDAFIVNADLDKAIHDTLDVIASRMPVEPRARQ